MSSSPAPAKFKSPMPRMTDRWGPRHVPFWLTALAGLAAGASLAFALLLYQKL